MTYLPAEILCMVCSHLWHQRDFKTLFNCACSGKKLATIALMNLYRIQAVAPGTNGYRDEDAESDSDSDEDTESDSDEDTESDSDEDTESDSDEELSAVDRVDSRIDAAHAMWLSRQRIFLKRAGLWRTIILSSLGKTLFPYSQYIRTLNLRDLEKLLRECESTTSRVSKFFFHDELANFEVERSKFTCYTPRLDVVKIIGRIGEVITKQTPQVEKLTGEVLSETLSRWIPRLPQLTHLEQWYSTAITDNGALIRRHCPSFKGLYFRHWSSKRDSSRQILAAFLNDLRPQSLESFKTFIYLDLEPDFIKALSCHGESLTELKLNMFRKATTFPNLSLLQGCINLVSLSLTGNRLYYSDNEQSHHEGFRKIVKWLKECKNLRVLAFIEFISPSWIAPILLESGIRLSSLRHEGPELRDINPFHQALPNQTSLQSLWLKGEIDEYAAEADALVNSLSKLVNLTDLHLGLRSAYFKDRHILQLGGSLPKLKVWSTDGCRITDAIWGKVGSLRSLQRLDLYAWTSFTTDGILDFIEKLGPSNNGLVLSILNADKKSRVEPQLIQEVIAKKVEGTFNFKSHKRDWRNDVDHQ